MAVNWRNREVTQIPLTELWGDSGRIVGHRGEPLDRAAIRELLRTSPVQFVIADVGHKPAWIPLHECYERWKSEIRSHVVENESWSREDFAGEYCYIATRWATGDERVIVLLEKDH